MTGGPLTYGSLFTGIGGFDLGFDRAGFRCAFQVEIDPFCRRVLAKHWPTVPRFEDIRTVTAADLPPVDVLIGGFPCQDLSTAGKQEGITGDRSGLWGEFARIIRAIRPGAVCVENVPGLLVRGMGRVCGDLASERYDLEWDSLSAAAVGAHHIRDRVWIIGARRDLSDTDRRRIRERGKWQREQYDEPRAAVTTDHGPAGPMADTDGAGPSHRGQSDQGSNGGPGRAAACTGDTGQGLARPGSGRGTLRAGPMADADGGRCQGRGQSQPDWKQSEPRRITDRRGQRRPRVAPWPVEPGLGRMAHGISDRVDRLRGLGNAAVPQCAEVAARRLLDILAP